jgi:hypothetical protein
MSWLQRLADVTITVLTIFLLIAFWTTDVSIENQFIPTLVNGITSCISLIVGFTITAIAIAISQFKHPKDAGRIAITLILLMFPILSLFYAYGDLMDREYFAALKFAMYALIIAAMTLYSFVVFLTLKLHGFEQEHARRKGEAT